MMLIADQFQYQPSYIPFPKSPERIHLPIYNRLPNHVEHMIFYMDSCQRDNNRIGLILFS